MATLVREMKSDHRQLPPWWCYPKSRRPAVLKRHNRLRKLYYTAINLKKRVVG